MKSLEDLTDQTRALVHEYYEKNSAKKVRKEVNVLYRDYLDKPGKCLKVLYHIYETGNYLGLNNRVFEEVDERFNALMIKKENSPKNKKNSRFRKRFKKLKRIYNKLIRKIEVFNHNRIYTRKSDESEESYELDEGPTDEDLENEEGRY